MTLQPRSAAQVATVEVMPSPTRLERPTFLMAFPFSLSTDVPNNPWMQDLPSDRRQPDHRRAYNQFLEVYRFLSSEGLVYLLPAPASCGLQDVVFTANLGVILEHLTERDVAVLSRFTSEPRRGEAAIGLKFFRDLGYECHVPPAKFEGDAELKHLHDNVYVGGYGIRSEPGSYDWMEKQFGMRVVKLRLTDPYLYHLDCTVFPITREDTLLCTELYEPEEVDELARHTNIIDVSVEEAYNGICNSVRLSNTILNSSHIHELRAGTEDYALELQKNRKLEDIALRLAFEVNYFNLSEYHKSGALLSCMVMHLNRYSYNFKLLN
ncbi:MAG TPA: arginine deiminase-related protein [Candidatus Cryosericum sp.]|nr:arginine deiminase-related protein [Candidatus Cryosericum sp.]